MCPRQQTAKGTSRIHKIKSFSTIDHVHSINQLKETCPKHNIPLMVAFVDYNKAFDYV